MCVCVCVCVCCVSICVCVCVCVLCVHVCVCVCVCVPNRALSVTGPSGVNTLTLTLFRAYLPMECTGSSCYGNRDLPVNLCSLIPPPPPPPPPTLYFDPQRGGLSASFRHIGGTKMTPKIPNQSVHVYRHFKSVMIHPYLHILHYLNGFNYSCGSLWRNKDILCSCHTVVISEMTVFILCNYLFGCLG